jgi:large subunit ribosomal protein L31e
MERIYTIPLRQVFESPKPRRANKAVRVVRYFLAKHMKATDVKIDASINEAIWEHNREKPPRKIKVKAVKEDGEDTVTASLVEE